MSRPDGLNAFERLLKTFAPGWAVNRFQNRVRLETAARAYEAAKPSRLRRKRADSRSKDQINAVSADRLRFQARYLDENHDLGRSVLNTLVANVVGPGLRTIPMIEAPDGALHEDVNESLLGLWRDFCRRPEVTWEYDWPEAQALACRSWMRDGEVFGQLVMGNVPKLDHGTRVKFSVELLEADFCPAAYNVPEDGVRQGIRKNAWGRPLEYFVYRDYPTESLRGGILFTPQQSTLAISRGELKAVPASRMLHLKNVDRIRETRGITIFSSVFTRLDDLKDYEESERVAARIAAAFALQIKRMPEFDGAPESGIEWREMDVAPGLVADGMRPGEEISTIKNDRPSNNLKEFRTSQLRAVAGGTQAGFSSTSKEYDGTYSSQRQELMEQNANYQTIRNKFASRFVDPVYRAFVQMAVTQGLVSTRGINPDSLFNATHIGRGIPYLDPDRETKAEDRAITAGITSRTQVQLARGLDPSEIRRQQKQERDRDNADGLAFGQKTATPVSSDPDKEIEPEDEEDNDDDGDRAVVVISGPPGQAGRRGRRGLPGRMPGHEWNDGGQVRFQNPDGTWGPWNTPTQTEASDAET